MNAPKLIYPRVLSIAGSDSGGGAGIQADLKAFARCGVHGMTAITAVTAQNTVAVTAVYPLPGEVIVEQVRAVAEDIGVDAVKIGMLGSAETVEAVARALDLVGQAPVVLDPVMVAESGAPPARTRRPIPRCATQLLPRVAVATPNLPEARVLARAAEDAEPEELLRAIHERSAPTWWSSPAATGRRPRTCSSMVSGSSRYPASDTRMGPPTDRDVPIPRPWRRTWRWVWSRSRRRAGPRRSQPRPCATGCEGWAGVPGRST